MGNLSSQALLLSVSISAVISLAQIYTFFSLGAMVVGPFLTFTFPASLTPSHFRVLCNFFGMIVTRIYQTTRFSGNKATVELHYPDIEPNLSYWMLYKKSLAQFSSSITDLGCFILLIQWFSICGLEPFWQWLNDSFSGVF